MSETSKFPFLPVLLGLGALGAIFLTGESKAGAAPNPPAPGPSGPPTPVTPPPDAKPTVPLKTPKIRVIDASTGTPSSFASKYGGSAARWKELAAINEVKLVDIPVEGRISTLEFGIIGYRDKGNTVMLKYASLTPWNIGQSIVLPEDWPG